jgi:hypothetical protein
MEKQPEEQEFNTNTPFWERTKQIAKVTALSAFLSLIGPESGLSKSVQSKELTVEQLQSEIVRVEKEIIKIVEKKGRNFSTIIDDERSNYIFRNHTGKEETKKEKSIYRNGKVLLNKNGNYIKVGHSDNGKVWILLDQHNNIFTYLDNDGDGIVDRVIINHDTGDIGVKSAAKHQGKKDLLEKINEEFKPIQNEADIFSGLENLKVSAGFVPVDKIVLEILRDAKGNTIKILDMNRAEITELKTGVDKEADHIIENTEQSFLIGLKSFEQK